MGSTSSAPKFKNPKVGIGIIVYNDDHDVLVGKRIDSQLYGFPGGHLGFAESIEHCAQRKLKKETNVSLDESQFTVVDYFNVIREEEDFHFLDIDVACHLKASASKETRNMAPQHSEDWQWRSWEQIKENIDEMFYPIKELVEKYPRFENVLTRIQKNNSYSS